MWANWHMEKFFCVRGCVSCRENRTNREREMARKQRKVNEYRARDKENAEEDELVKSVRER